MLNRTKQVVLRGHCWKVGHSLAIDGPVLPDRFVKVRETDPEILKRHLFEEVNQRFAQLVKPGDVVVTGKRFAHGNPHAYAFIGMKALGIGLVTESITWGSFRNAISMGVPVLPFCPGVTEHVSDGDDLEVDFGTGVVRNLTTMLECSFRPLPVPLLEIILIGGLRQQTKRRVMELTHA